MGPIADRFFVNPQYIFIKESPVIYGVFDKLNAENLIDFYLDTT